MSDPESSLVLHLFVVTLMWLFASRRMYVLSDIFWWDKLVCVVETEVEHFIWDFLGIF